MNVREKAIKHFESLQKRYTKQHNGKMCEYVKEALDAMTAHGVTVQQCGEWEEIEDDWSMETIYKCSACKEEFVTIDGTPADNLWNYCPHCGAKMMPQPPKGE